MFPSRLRPVSLLILASIVAAFGVVAVLFPSGAEARTRVNAPAVLSMRRVRSPYPGPGTSPRMEAAIASTFPAALARQALNVAWCESRGLASARNGQYRGHFQIGASEWRTYGSGDPYNAEDNSRAAYRYYLAVGSWSPWQCQP